MVASHENNVKGAWEWGWPFYLHSTFCKLSKSYPCHQTLKKGYVTFVISTPEHLSGDVFKLKQSNAMGEWPFCSSGITLDTYVRSGNTRTAAGAFDQAVLKSALIGSICSSELQRSAPLSKLVVGIKTKGTNNI